MPTLFNDLTIETLLAAWGFAASQPLHIDKKFVGLSPRAAMRDGGSARFTGVGRWCRA
jgi:hypothetical protein